MERETSNHSSGGPSTPVSSSNPSLSAAGSSTGHLATRYFDYPKGLAHYDLIKVLGKGRCATVFYAKDKKYQNAVAIKMISEDKTREHSRLSGSTTEIEVLMLCRHRNDTSHLLVHFREPNQTFLVMTYASNGSLDSYVTTFHENKIPESLAAKFIKQIAGALHFLHTSEFIHRDVKPANILIDENQNALLSDFGLCTSPSPFLNEFVGTQGFMAPEVLLRRRYNHFVDNWSLGVTSYVIICGRHPFPTKSRTGAIGMAKNYELLDFPTWLQDEAKLLILGLLAFTPHYRLRLDSVPKNPWIISPPKLGSMMGRRKIYQNPDPNPQNKATKS